MKSDDGNLLARLLLETSRYGAECLNKYSEDVSLDPVVRALSCSNLIEIRRGHPVHTVGDFAPVSGQYNVFDRLGVFQFREITISRGEKFPPSPTHSGPRSVMYQLADATKHWR